MPLIKLSTFIYLSFLGTIALAAPSHSVPAITSIQPRNSPKQHVLLAAVPYYEDATLDHIKAEREKQMVYGVVDGKNNVMYGLVNFTSQAPQNHLLANLESFIPFIQNIKCGSNKIDLAFKSKDAYDVASTWPAEFDLLTTTQEYCGSGDDRTMYEVLRPRFYPRSSSVVLPITRIPISQESTPFAVSWGNHLASKISQRATNKKRDHQENDNDGMRAEISRERDIVAPKIARVVRNFFSAKIDKRSLQETPLPDVPFDIAYNAGFLALNASNPFGRGSVTMTCSTPGDLCGIFGSLELWGQIGATDAVIDHGGYYNWFQSLVSPADFTINSLFNVNFAKAGTTSDLNPVILGQTPQLVTYEIENICTLGFNYTLSQKLYTYADGPGSISGVGFNIDDSFAYQNHGGGIVTTVNYTDSTGPSAQASMEAQPVDPYDMYNFATKPLALASGIGRYFEIKNEMFLTVGTNFQPIPGSPVAKMKRTQQKRQECEGIECLPCLECSGGSGVSEPPPPTTGSRYGIREPLYTESQFGFPGFVTIIQSQPVGTLYSPTISNTGSGTQRACLNTTSGTGNITIQTFRPLWSLSGGTSKSSPATYQSSPDVVSYQYCDVKSWNNVPIPRKPTCIFRTCLPTSKPPSHG